MSHMGDREILFVSGRLLDNAGELTHMHQCGPGSIHTLGIISGLSLLVLYSEPGSFSPGTPV